MPQLECLLCLEINEDKRDCIKIKTSNEQNIKKLIEKHLWPMKYLKSKSPWICLVCLEMLEDFHSFFKRIEDAHLYYNCLAQCENESEDGEEVLINKQTENLAVTKQGNTSKDDEELTGDCNYESLTKLQNKNAHENHDSEENNIENNDLENPSVDEELTIENYQYDEESIEELEIQEHIEEIVIEDVELTDYLDEESYELELVLEDNYDHNEEMSTEMSEVDSNTLTSGDNSKELARLREKTYSREMGYTHDKFLAKHYEIACDLCKISFETFTQLIQHFVENHSGTIAYTNCCGTKFFSRASLVEHINIHLDPNLFKCTLCSKVLKSRCNLIKHLAWHDGKLYRCKICYSTFMNQSKLDKHELKHGSNEKPRRIPCSECDQTFRNKSCLKQHQRRIHLNSLIKLCTICGTTFRDHYAFKRHMANHEGKPSPTLIPCDICGIVLSRKQSVKIHKELKHPEAGKPALTCSVCHKYKSTSRSKIRDHIRLVHTKTRIHKCHICEKSFKERSKLKQHMGMHTGEPIYTCNFCPMTFYSTGNLSSHRIRLHPKEWEEFKRKKFEGQVHPIADKESP